MYVSPHPWDALPPPTFTDPVAEELKLDDRIEELEERLEGAERSAEDLTMSVEDIRSELDRLRGPSKR